MKNIFTLIGAFIASVSLSHSAWVWSDWGDANNPTGTSGRVEMTPVSANYDGGNGVNGAGWDRTPESFFLTWSSSTNVVLDLATRINGDGTDSGSIEYLEIRPTDSSVTSFDLSIDMIFPFTLVVRGDSGQGQGGLLGNGGLGFPMNPIGVTIDSAKFSAETAAGSVIPLNQSTTSGAGQQYGIYGSLKNASGDVGDYGSIIGTGWRGLFGDTTYSPVAFAWPSTAGDAVDPNTSLGRQKWILEGINVDAETDVIRMSFDGGVPAGSVNTK